MSSCGVVALVALIGGSVLACSAVIRYISKIIEEYHNG